MALTILDASQDLEYDIDPSNLDDLEFEGIDHRDYPDYCDAFFSSATETKNGKSRDLSDEELEWVIDQYPEWFSEKLHDYMH